jgi:endonuclease/exonuclease/phosphatase family metal-dependent hydrolase
VLTWNLFHGRDGDPEAGPTWASTLLRRPVAVGDRLHLNRRLLGPMARVLARAEPDLCLLQEVPPRAVRDLARALRADAVWALTGPRLGPPGPRARLGAGNADLWRTHEGNANAVLVGPRLRRVPGSARAPFHLGAREKLGIVRSLGLRPGEALSWLAEPRRLVAVRVRTPGGVELLAACLHAHGGGPPEVVALELRRAAALALAEAGDAPLVLGGDLNARRPGDAGILDELGRMGLGGTEEALGLDIDRILARGLEVVDPPRRLPRTSREVVARGRGREWRVLLSDHDPVVATLRPPPG